MKKQQLYFLDGNKKKGYNGYHQPTFNATGRLILNRSLDLKHNVDDVIKFYPIKKDYHECKDKFIGYFQII